MHKSGSIITLILFALAPVAVEAQGAPKPPGTAKVDTAPGNLPTVTVLRPDTISLTALHLRVLELERRRPDPLTEQVKWGAFGAIGVVFSLAWLLVRRTEKQERTETTLRQLVKEMSKDPSEPAEIEKKLNELVAKFEIAIGQVRAVGVPVDTTLSEIKTRLSDASKQIIDIQRELDRRAHP